MRSCYVANVSGGQRTNAAFIDNIPISQVKINKKRELKDGTSPQVELQISGVYVQGSTGVFPSGAIG